MHFTDKLKNTVLLISPAFVAVLMCAGFLSFLLPLPEHETFTYGVGVVCVGIAFLISLVEATVKNYTDGLNNKVNAPSLLLCAFWCVALLSVVLSEIPTVSFIYFCLFSAMPMSFFTVNYYQGYPWFLKVLLTGLGSLYVLLALAAWAQYFFYPELLLQGFVHRPLANPNALGALFSLGLFGTLGSLFITRRKFLSVVTTVTAILLFGALLTTGSRGAFVAFITMAGILIGALLLFKQQFALKDKKYETICFFMVSVCLLVLFTWLAPEKSKTPAELWSLSISPDNPLLWSRPAIWASTWEIIKSHIFTGTGIGTFFLYYPEVRGADTGTAGLSAHNDPLQFWSEMGILAPFLFYTLGAYLLFKTIRILLLIKQKTASGKILEFAHMNQAVLLVVSFSALSAMAIHSHISNLHYIVQTLFIAGIFLAVWSKSAQTLSSYICNAGSELDSDRSVIKNSQVYINSLFITGKIFAVLCVAFFIFAFARMQMSHVRITQARVSAKTGDLEGYGKYVNAAHHWSGGRNANAYVLASSALLGQLENTPDTVLSLSEAQALYSDAYTMLNKAQALNPRLSSVYLSKARLDLALKKRIENVSDDRILSSLKEALRLDPLHVMARITLAELYLEDGKKAEAYAVLKAGLKWPTRHQMAPAYYQKTAFLALEMGDTVTHTYAMQKFLRMKKGHRAR